MLKSVLVYQIKLCVRTSGDVITLFGQIILSKMDHCLLCLYDIFPTLNTMRVYTASVWGQSHGREGRRGPTGRGLNRDNLSGMCIGLNQS